MKTEVLITIISLGWAFVLLMLQYLKAWGGGRKDFSAKSGNPKSAVIYNFTYAMLPKHKEVIRNHPIKFVVGITMHTGAFYSIFRTFVALLFPGNFFIYPYLLSVALCIPVLCGVYLFVRRILNKNLRSMSSFDDYFAILMTICITVFSILLEVGFVSELTFLIAASVLFFYMPLGKLKHVLFFFLARLNYGSRLGYRGIYPTSDRN